MKKLIFKNITFIFIAALFMSISIAKADTFSFSYTDPTLAPTGCSCNRQADGSYYCTSDVGGLTCHNPNVIINSTINLSFSNGTVPLSAQMPVTYQVCSIHSSGSTCADGRSGDAYSGSSRLMFGSAHTSNFSAVGRTDSKRYNLNGCATGCQNEYISIASGGSLVWSSSINPTASTPITLSQAYDISLTIKPRIRTRGTQSSEFNLQEFTISKTHVISVSPTTSPSTCSTTADASFCVSTISFYVRGDNTQYKVGASYNGSTIKSYRCNPDNVYGGSSVVTVYYENDIPCGGSQPNTPPAVQVR